MRQPAFWHQHPGLAAGLLSPLAAVYAIGVRRSLAAGASHRPGIPVICVGNLNVGGTGKTPTAIALGQHLHELGRRPHFVSRGFGGRKVGPDRVDPDRDNAAEVGDEPLLLASFAPTWIGRDRQAVARAAKSAGADSIILDDGFQNASLHYDLSILVIDAVNGFGNGRVLPAGPLRERPVEGLSRADLVIIIGAQKDRERFLERWGGSVHCPTADARIVPLATGEQWSGMHVVAFAGIGHPQKFFHTLRSLGAEIVRAIPLADHQPINARLLLRLQALARSRNAALVTTEKDAVRLPDAWRARVLTLPVRLQFTDPEIIADRLQGLLQRFQPVTPSAPHPE